MNQPRPAVAATLSDAIGAMVEARLADVHISMPGRVESYDKTRQTAAVKPLVQRGYDGEDGDRLVESYPVLPDVPVAFYGGGGGSHTFPLQKGDSVWLQFASCSLDLWKQRGGEVDPGDDRRFALSDAICFPAVRPHGAQIGADGVDDVAQVIAGPAVYLGGSQGVQPTFMAASAKTAIDALIVAIEAVFTGIQAPSTFTGAVQTAWNAAKTAFDTALSAAETSIVKVK